MKPCDDCVATQVAVIDKKQAVLCIIRVESQSKQALFCMLAVYFADNIQEWNRNQLIILRYKNATTLLDNEQSP